MAKRTKKRKHSCNGQFCFHGAFKRKSDAEAKARRVGRSAFVRGKFVGPGRGSYRYVVMERDAGASFDF